MEGLSRVSRSMNKQEDPRQCCCEDGKSAASALADLLLMSRQLPGAEKLARVHTTDMRDTPTCCRLQQLHVLDTEVS